VDAYGRMEWAKIAATGTIMSWVENTWAAGLPEVRIFFLSSGTGVLNLIYP
jgi:hypothetical protein